jgi:hypothetical protein
MPRVLIAVLAVATVLAAAALGYLLHKSAQELAQPNPARAKVVFPYPEIVREQ